MAFNFGAFMGGATDQYNKSVAANQNQQRIDQQAEALQEQIASSQQAREERAREAEIKQQSQAADDAMNQALAENLAKVGKTPEPTVTKTPALLAAPVEQQTPATPLAGSVLPANVGVPAAVTQGEDAAPKREVSVMPGGLDQYQKSDALLDTAKRLAALNVPAYSARAAKLMELAQASKGQEAWDMAAQTGDYGAAMTHLTGRQTDVSAAPDGSLVMTDPKSGRTLDTFKDGDEFLSRLGAIRNPDAFSAYQKNIAANLQQQLQFERQRSKDQSDMLYKAATLGQKSRELDIRENGGSGKSGSSGARSGKGGIFGSDTEIAKYIETMSGKPTDGNPYNMGQAVNDFKQIAKINPDVSEPSYLVEASRLARTAPDKLMPKADAQTGSTYLSAPVGDGSAFVRVAPLQENTPRFIANKAGETVPLDAADSTTANRADIQRSLKDWGNTTRGQSLLAGLKNRDEADAVLRQGVVQVPGNDGMLIQKNLSDLDPKTALAVRNAAQLYLLNNPAPKAQSPSSTQLVGGVYSSTGGPTYEKWKAAQAQLAEVQKNASKMAPDSAEIYLANRVPELEKVISDNAKYPRY